MFKDTSSQNIERETNQPIEVRLRALSVTISLVGQENKALLVHCEIICVTCLKQGFIGALKVERIRTRIRLTTHCQLNLHSKLGVHYILVHLASLL